MNSKNRCISDLLRCPAGAVDLASFDSAATPGYPKGMDKDDAPALTGRIETELDDLQERLYASGLSDPRAAPSVLLVLQGLDTAGKGGVIRHVIGMVDPQGVRIKAFKVPTPEERAHDFLWRIRPHTPGPGQLGIFDRSHYEDVLVHRVEELSPRAEIERRYGAINQFEAELAAQGTRIIKCFLHISKAEQRERLLARLANPDKYYKYNPGDIDSALRFDQYTEAYNIALTRCNTAAGPWYIVPSDRKWYRHWAIAHLLLEELDSLGLQWPAADFDVAAEQARANALPTR